MHFGYVFITVLHVFSFKHRDCSGNKYLTCLDSFLKWPQFRGIPFSDSETEHKVNWCCLKPVAALKIQLKLKYSAQYQCFGKSQRLRETLLGLPISFDVLKTRLREVREICGFTVQVNFLVLCFNYQNNKATPVSETFMAVHGNTVLWTFTPSWILHNRLILTKIFWYLKAASRKSFVCWL